MGPSAFSSDSKTEPPPTGKETPPPANRSNRSLAGTSPSEILPRSSTMLSRANCSVTMYAADTLCAINFCKRYEDKQNVSCSVCQDFDASSYRPPNRVPTALIASITGCVYHLILAQNTLPYPCMLIVKKQRKRQHNTLVLLGLLLAIPKPAHLCFQFRLLGFKSVKTHAELPQIGLQVHFPKFWASLVRLKLFSTIGIFQLRNTLPMLSCLIRENRYTMHLQLQLLGYWTKCIAISPNRIQIGSQPRHFHVIKVKMLYDHSSNPLHRRFWNVALLLFNWPLRSFADFNDTRKAPMPFRLLAALVALF